MSILYILYFILKILYQLFIVYMLLLVVKFNVVITNALMAGSDDPHII